MKRGEELGVRGEALMEAEAFSTQNEKLFTILKEALAFDPLKKSASIKPIFLLTHINVPTVQLTN
ncbi:MAG: hypothetical protein U9N81_09660 [Bacillota bacterium]|nr:hypothetical protein [Bacillota bacterium]